MPSEQNPNPFPDDQSILLCIPGTFIIPPELVYHPPPHIEHAGGNTFLYIHRDLCGNGIFLHKAPPE